VTVTPDPTKVVEATSSPVTELPDTGAGASMSGGSNSWSIFLLLLGLLALAGATGLEVAKRKAGRL
jgi:hypothetical protein